MSATIGIHTGGELHPVPKMPVPDFVFNLSRLLDDPLRKPDDDLVKRDGLDPRMQDFVFGTEGAEELYLRIRGLIVSQFIDREKSTVVLILCRGGKHRSVAFGDKLSRFFGVVAQHHHRHLPIVRIEK